MAKLTSQNEFLSRRFGVELEYNAFDKLDRSISENDLPSGIFSYAKEISKRLKTHVEVGKWHYTNDNKNWVIKPDASCGLEVCSPVLRGTQGLRDIAKVVKVLSSGKNTSADERCSLHIHVEIADFTWQDILSLFKTWVCCELFFYFMTSPKRWLNPYCQPIGFSLPIENISLMNYNDVYELLGNYKYFAINLFHYKKGKRQTVEFRIMGNQACLDPEESQKWCELILMFVHRVKDRQGDIARNKNIEYWPIPEVLQFLDLKYFADNKEMLLWVVDKLNNLIDNKTLFDKYNQQRYIWEELVFKSQDDLRAGIDFLERYL